MLTLDWQLQAWKGVKRPFPNLKVVRYALQKHGGKEVRYPIPTEPTAPVVH